VAEIVNVESFVMAETARMFDGALAQTGGVNVDALRRAQTRRMWKP
jgi:hypothetical protein